MKIKRCSILFVVALIACMFVAPLTTSASTIVYPKFKAFTATGGPLAGGLLYTLKPGTTWPTGAKTSYTDKHLTTAATNPIVLDAAGEAAVYGKGGYKLILKTAAGVTMWTMDNVDGIGSTAYASINDYGGDLAAAVAAIGSTPAQLLIDSAVVMTASVVIPSNIVLQFIYGGCITTTGFTLTASDIIADNFQIFCGTGTVKLPIYVVRNPWWWGAVFDGVTDDHAAWYYAMLSFTATGGTIKHPGGISYIATPIIVPNDGTQTYPIGIEGGFSINRNGSTGTAESPESVILAGATAFDLRGGIGANLIGQLSLKSLYIKGPGTSGPVNVVGTYGIYAYGVRNCTWDNVTITYFERGISLEDDTYYNTFNAVATQYNDYGVYGYYATMNGQRWSNCKFSHNLHNGMYLRYFGDAITLDTCWVETNGEAGVVLTYGGLVYVTSSYFEGNTPDHISVTGGGIYTTNVTIVGTHFQPITSTSTYSMYSLRVSAVENVTLMGNKLWSFNRTTDTPAGTGYTIHIVGNIHPNFCLIGNQLPEGDQARGWNGIVNAQHLSGALVSNFRMPGIGLNTGNTSKGAYLSLIPQGQFLLNPWAYTKFGGMVGWIATTPGAGSQMQLNTNATTAASTAGSNVITPSSMTDLFVGAVLKLAGETWGALAAAYATIVDVGTSTVTLDHNATVGVSGAALRYNTATLADVFGLLYYKSVDSVSTNGTSNQTLMAAPNLPEDYLTAQSTVVVEAEGSFTGSAGSGNIKCYFGSTPITVWSGSIAAGSWSAEVIIQMIASAQQTITSKFYDTTSGLAYNSTIGTESIADELELKFKGGCTNGTSTIKQRTMRVMPR